MKKNFWAFFFVFFFTYFVSSTTHAGLPQIKKTTLYKIFEPVFSIIGYREIKVQVYDQDTLFPIENAVVMIGETDNAPFEKNWTTTDKNGVSSFDGFMLPQGPLTITAGHEAYSRYTIFQTQANEFRIPLSRLKEEPTKTPVSGSFSNWPDMEDRDGVIQIGILVPATDILSLLNFSSEKLAAPFVKAQIYKEVKVPGNLVIPSQEELYWGFVPVYLSKPTYQMPFLSGTQQNLIALTGEIPFSKFASGFINKQPLSQLLNLVSMNQLGLARDWKVPTTPATLDIPLNYTLKSKFSVSITQSPAHMDILYFSAAAFMEKLAALFPLDFKISARADKAKTATLKSLPASNLFPPFQEMVVAVAADLPQTSSETRKRDTAITGIVKRPKTDTTLYLNTFLNLVDITSASQHFSYKDRASSSPEVPSQMSVSYMSIHLPSTQEQKGYTKVWWAVVAPSSMTEFALPVLPRDLSQAPSLQPKEELEWSLNVLGLNEKNYIFDYNNLDETTLSLGLSHFSQNSLTLAKTLE